MYGGKRAASAVLPDNDVWFESVAFKYELECNITEHTISKER